MKELRVICNPFTGLDHEGVPAGVYPFDPEHGAGARRWVGASIDRSRTTAEKPSAGPKAPTTLVSTGAKTGRRIASVPVVNHRHFFAFDLSPQRVPNVEHYRWGIIHGDLFPADLATANELGLKKFTPPSVALAAARDKALADWKAAHVDPDFSLWPEALRPGGAKALVAATAEEPAVEAQTPIAQAPEGAGSVA